MPSDTAQNVSDLRKRVVRFLASNNYSRNEVRAVIEKISPLGEVVIFGGAIRDIALRGNKEFPNDVDMVVASSDILAIEDAIKEFRVTKNRFGGYRISLNKWKVDLWPLSLTWAFREGYVKGEDFHDLLKTTFFDWDAVLFNLSSGSIMAVDGYIERLQSRIIDLVLEPNPNRLGATVRTLRLCVSRSGRLAPRLSNYLLENLKQVDIASIISAERSGYAKPILSEANVIDVVNKLSRHSVERRNEPFGEKLEQLSLI